METIETTKEKYRKILRDKKITKNIKNRKKEWKQLKQRKRNTGKF